MMPGLFFVADLPAGAWRLARDGWVIHTADRVIVKLDINDGCELNRIGCGIGERLRHVEVEK
jgi:hypothetical protein